MIAATNVVHNIANRGSIESLAFAYWQYTANEKAFANKLITKTMYEFAKGELRKSIGLLEKACYRSV